MEVCLDVLVERRFERAGDFSWSRIVPSGADASHRRNFARSRADEDLFRRAQIVRSEVLFQEFVARGGNDLMEHLAGYSREAPRSERWSQNLALAHEEEVGRCALGQVTQLVQKQSIVKSLGVDPLECGRVVHPGEHLRAGQSSGGIDRVGHQREVVSRRPLHKFAREDQ